MIPERNMLINIKNKNSTDKPVLFCWGVDNQLFVYDQNNKQNIAKSKKGQSVNLYFQETIQPSFRDMVKEFSEVFQKFHQERQKIDEDFINKKTDEIKKDFNNQNSKSEIEQNFMIKYHDISIQALENYIEVFRKYIYSEMNLWSKQQLDAAVISLIYYDFIKNLKLEKQRSKITKQPFSKSEMIVTLLNLYLERLDNKIHLDVLQFDCWTQIYHQLKFLKISEVISLLENQRDYDKRIILNIIDALKMKKYFFKGQDARLIPKQDFIRRHEEFKQRIQEISKNVNQQSQLYFFLQVLSGNIQFIFNLCQQDWISFVIFYILFANPIFTIDQLNNQIYQCYQNSIEESQGSTQQMFYFLVTQIDCFASIQRAQDILPPFHFFHLIDVLQTVNITFEEQTPIYDQLKRNYREETQFRFLQYLQNDAFDYQIMSIYINNFLERVDIKEKKTNHIQTFEDLLISKSNSINNFAQIVQDVQKDFDPILNESIKSQISAKAMSLLQQNQYHKALEFYIQLADFQIDEYIHPLNQDTKKILTPTQLEENYKYLRELIVNQLFQKNDIDLKSIVDCLESKACVFNKHDIHAQVLRKHLNFLYSFEKLSDLISKLNRDNSFSDKNMLGSVEQGIYNLVKLQNSLSKELVIALRLIESVLNISQIKLSQQIYDILVLRAQQLMREIKEKLIEFELLNDEQNIQIYKQLKQEMQHFISIVMNSYTL